jgi:hypothetical protein
MVESPFITLYLHPQKRFQAVTPLLIEWDVPQKKVRAGQPADVGITLTNTGTDTVHTGNLLLGSVFVKAWEEKYASTANLPFTDNLLPPGYTKKLRITLQPPTKKGNYYLIFSVLQPPLAGSFASEFYKINVE